MNIITGSIPKECLGLDTTFDIKKAVQEQLQLLLDCDDEDELAIIRGKIDILIAVYSSGMLSSDISSEF